MPGRCVPARRRLRLPRGERLSGRHVWVQKLQFFVIQGDRWECSLRTMPPRCKQCGIKRFELHVSGRYVFVRSIRWSHDLWQVSVRNWKPGERNTVHMPGGNVPEQRWGFLVLWGMSIGDILGYRRCIEPRCVQRVSSGNLQRIRRYHSSILSWGLAVVLVFWVISLWNSFGLLYT